ncbi:hypothetical protein G7Y89_g8063 [Cudoniella acicularis]|uniref:Uncharacterized protein n=1 Tax=Cudoniella acicularis TaxID=354080 RepID=A0A8H4RKX1_9HELO|nr:hypothetical protein G7Y89_g8063 [Cudoniella acicularis]
MTQFRPSPPINPQSPRQKRAEWASASLPASYNQTSSTRTRTIQNIKPTQHLANRIRSSDQATISISFIYDPNYYVLPVSIPLHQIDTSTQYYFKVENHSSIASLDIRYHHSKSYPIYNPKTKTKMHAFLALPTALLAILLTNTVTAHPAPSSTSKPYPQPTPGRSQTLTLRTLYADYAPLPIPSPSPNSPPRTHRPRILSQILLHQKPLSQQPPHGEIIPFPSGTLNMASTHSHHIPLSFSLSPKVCTALTPELVPLISDLSDTILDRYPRGIRLARECHKLHLTEITETDTTCLHATNGNCKCFDHSHSHSPSSPPLSIHLTTTYKELPTTADPDISLATLAIQQEITPPLSTSSSSSSSQENSQSGGTVALGEREREIHSQSPSPDDLYYLAENYDHPHLSKKRKLA